MWEPEPDLELEHHPFRMGEVLVTWAPLKAIVEVVHLLVSGVRLPLPVEAQLHQEEIGDFNFNLILISVSISISISIFLWGLCGDRVGIINPI